MRITVCIGSSCHLKGSHEIVEKFKKAISENNLEDKIDLGGSFCLGKCNRDGVSIAIDDELFTGVTVEGFDAFFKENVLNKI